MISLKIDWFHLLAAQGTLRSLLQPHNSKVSILRHSAFFTVQFSQWYVTAEKSIALDCTDLRRQSWTCALLLGTCAFQRKVYLSINQGKGRLCRGGAGPRWGVRERVLPLPDWVTTANLCLSPGLGLPVARGKDWTRWSLRARPAVTFSSGTAGRRTDVPGGSAVCQGLLLHYPLVLPGENPY